MTDTIRLMIVDDHPVVRTGIRGMLAEQAQFDIVGEASNGEEALAMAKRLIPQVILMDLRMPELDGIGALKRLHDELPAIRVLILTTYDSDYDLRAALDAGASGYLLKDTPREELYRAIRLAAAGKSVIDPNLAERILPFTANQSGELLSKREINVLRLVAHGQTNKQIGNTLHISEATVKTHLRHIFRKLNAPDRAAAVASAIKRRIISMDDAP